MASNINSNNIDITYPIAGQDNDTQGFRTNWQNIQQNFSVASSEISAIQGNVLTLQTAPVWTGNITAGNVAITSGIFWANGSNYSSTLYGNTNVATFLPVYTGNLTANTISAYNKVVTGTLTLSNALQFANLTTTQITAISSPTRGMTVYNYTTGNIQVYNGTKWANVTLS